MKVNTKKIARYKRKRIVNIFEKYKKKPKIEISAQDSIPFQEIYKDGIVRIDKDFYSKSIFYEDINYHLASDSDQRLIFGEWCNFLNYFDESINVQFNFINIAGENKDNFEEIIDIKEQNDEFNEVRMEFKNMLRNQLSKGNNVISKKKYLTFGIKAENYTTARNKLENIELAITNNFHRVGVKTHTLDGSERLEVLNSAIHLNQTKDRPHINFDFKNIAKTGLSPKEYIAPSSFNFGEMRYFKVGKQVNAVSFLQILSPSLDDRFLTKFLELNCSQNVSIHLNSVDHLKAIKMIKQKLVSIQKSKIDSQKKAVREGFDMGATRSLITA